MVKSLLFSCFLITGIGENWGAVAGGEAAGAERLRSHLAVINFKEVFRLVEEGEQHIGDLEKDIIVVLGRTGAGKSVTIDSLLGAEMFSREDGKIGATPSKADPGMVLADIGHTGSCTMRPAIYTSRRIPYSFLDTRGFEDTGIHPEGDIAASILTEMALRSANSIRVMTVVHMEAFTVDRGACFTGLGKTLGKIVLGKEIPMLFCFNRYNPQANAATFYRMPESRQEQVINEAVDREIRTIFEIEESAIRGVVDRVSSRMGKACKAVKGRLLKFFGSEPTPDAEIDEEVASDRAVHEAFVEKEYTAFLSYNCQRALLPPMTPPRTQNTVYLDPLSPESVARCSYYGLESYSKGIAHFFGVQYCAYLI